MRADRDGIAEIEPIIAKITARVIGGESPIPGLVSGEAIAGKCFVFAQEWDVSRHIGAGADGVYNGGLDVIFARDTVGIESDIIIATAPLAEVNGVAEGDIHDRDFWSVRRRCIVILALGRGGSGF